MIKDSVIDNLENLGFRIDFTLECARFYDGCGRLCGESLGFTQSDPTLFTKKQLDRMRLRVAALNPITYKVN